MKAQSASLGLLATAVTFAGALSVSEPAIAGLANSFNRASRVSDVVTDNGNGTWTYQYTVRNTSTFGGNDLTEPVIVDWELPWFGDAGILMSSITSPFNWSFSIETIGVANPSTGWEGAASWQDPNDPFYAGAGSPFTGVTQVLHWYNECWAGRQIATLTISSFAVSSCEGQFDNAIFMDSNGLGGFGFTAEYDATAAPYQASWANLPVRSGDPSFPLGGIPASPNATGQNVPIPGILALLGSGFLALGMGRGMRRRNPS